MPKKLTFSIFWKISEKILTEIFIFVENQNFRFLEEFRELFLTEILTFAKSPNFRLKKNQERFLAKIWNLPKIKILIRLCTTGPTTRTLYLDRRCSNLDAESSFTYQV